MFDLVKIEDSVSIHQLIGYVLALFSVIQIFLIFFIERNNIVTDLRGKDKTWQFQELSGIAWLVSFPILVACDLLGVTASERVWQGMEIIYFINILGRSANRLIEARFGVAPEEPTTPKKDKQDAPKQSAAKQDIPKEDEPPTL